VTEEASRTTERDQHHIGSGICASLLLLEMGQNETGWIGKAGVLLFSSSFTFSLHILDTMEDMSYVLFSASQDTYIAIGRVEAKY